MKKIAIIAFAVFLSSGMAYATDGICKCYFKVYETETTGQKLSTSTNRPVICDSCENRCEVMLERIKTEGNHAEVELDKFECP